MINTGERKSLDLYREIWINLAKNQRYADFVCEKDILTFRTRLANEGLTFLTTILPNLGRALDHWFASPPLIGGGYYSFNVPDFSSGKHGLPVFLGKAFESAVIDGSSLAVDCIRQLSYVFYKLEVDYDQVLVAEFLDNFEKVDKELETLVIDEKSSTIKIARSLISRILCNSDPKEIRPRHGSGSTACRTANHEKYHKLRYYRKLDEYFSYPDYFFYSFTHLSDEYEKLVDSNESSPMARVCLVPKDSRGPRIISCEPAELMFIQQGLMRKLYETIETHHLTKGYINFVDQGVNRALAHQSSIDGKYATLDLSEASDRVSLQLIRSLFPPNWVAALEASRSDSTVLPNGKILKLNKFAPMGSSCCFPVEALVFWAIACARTSFSTKSSVEVYVYGDDIIVPTDQAGTVIDGLHSVGLRVNINKSYVEGPFRESCGGDYHNGYDVTPVRVRKPVHASNSSITTDADLANLLIAKFGYTDTIINILDLLDQEYGSPLPRSPLHIPCCIWASSRASNDVYYARRWNKSLQRFEHRIRCVSTRALARCEPTWSELLRKELTRGEVRDSTDKYTSSISKIELELKPGYYADVHSAHEKWTWVWLG